ncbi:MAG: S1 RNA-binding domain-containing protein [Clostridia bacterium]|nr:S1 RNA-binding domain-containing protein [Clostridia bacterium]
MNGYFPEGWLSSSQENKRSVNTVSSLNEALCKGTVMESPVTMCDTGHNLIVNLGCMKGIIPREEGAIGISDGSTRDIALISRVGRPVCFVITDIRQNDIGKPYALLSRKKAQQLCKDNITYNSKVGDVIDARITHLETFGAFCDIGCGNIALLPIDSISVSRISHPRDRFKVGDDIKAIIKSIAPDGKITLSHKELLGTWKENAEMFSPGQTVNGIVRSVEDYGVFVELSPNLAGLAEPKPSAFIGQQASVYIKSVIPEKMKIKLIIIDSFDSDYIPDIKYFFTGSHIDRWDYSPEECSKAVFSEFN